MARGLHVHYNFPVTVVQLFGDDLMELKSLVGALSAERLTGYRRTGYSETSEYVSQRYLWNIKLCEALYPVLNLLEVTLRNNLHSALWLHTGHEDWYASFHFDQREAQAIQDTIILLKRNRKPVSPGAVVAEMSFGFWCSLFDVRYEHSQRLWPWLASQILRHAPRHERQRKSLSRRLNRLRLLRNRVFHYEPIWHWHDLRVQHAEAVEFLTWLNADMATVLASVDRFSAIHSAGEQGAPLLPISQTIA